MRAKLAGVCLFAGVLASAAWAPAQEQPRRPLPTSARRAAIGPPGSSSSAPVRSPTPTTAPTRSPWWWTSPRWTPRRSPPGSTWAPGRSSPARDAASRAPTGGASPGSRCASPAWCPTRSSRRTSPQPRLRETRGPRLGARARPPAVASASAPPAPAAPQAAAAAASASTAKGHADRGRHPRRDRGPARLHGEGRRAPQLPRLRDPEPGPGGGGLHRRHRPGERAVDRGRAGPGAAGAPRPVQRRLAQGRPPRPRPHARRRPTGSSTGPTACASCSATAAKPPARRTPLAALRSAEPEPEPSSRWRSRWPPRGRWPSTRSPCRPSPRRRPRRRRPSRGRSRAGERRSGLRADGLPRHADQPGLQGRRPPGHLPSVLRHLGPERRGEPRGHGQGHPEAERGSLGPRARAHPQDERPRLRARGQRDPHRQAHRPAARGADRRKLQEEKELAGDLVDFTRRISYAKAGPTSRTFSSARGPVRPRPDQRRRPHQHDHHPGPPGLRGQGHAPDRRARHRDPAGGDRGAHRGHHAELHARPRDPVGLRRGGDAPLRQHDEPGLPELDRDQRRRHPGSDRLPVPATSRARRPLVGGRHRRGGPRIRGQPAGASASTPPSESRWATSWEASTSTWR
jgi:hypothetical protein